MKDNVTKAVVIGSGLGGLALAIRLQSAGISTLHTMPPQAIEPVAAALPPFAQLLARHWPGAARNGSGDAR